MSDAPRREPEIEIAMGASEWRVVQLALHKAPLPLEMSYPVAARLESLLQVAMRRQAMNGASPMPEAPGAC